MKDKQEFYELLGELDGRDFSEYNRIIGDYDFSRYVLKVTRVPTDASEPGTLFLLRVPSHVAGFPAHLHQTPIRRTALEDLLVRKMSAAIEASSAYDEDGVSRKRLFLPKPGPQILPRSALLITEDYVEARVHVNLPVRRGRIHGEEARHVFFETLPAVVNASLIYCNLDEQEAVAFVRLMEDADALRQMLPTRGWVAFVGEGALLARRGPDGRAARTGGRPLAISAELWTEVELPNQGRIRGLGIPAGITVVVGDEYSGRVEFLKAIAAGIYNHIPGDGREYVISAPDAVYIAADPGRCIRRVDLGAFIRGDNPGREGSIYSTDDADPCASQMAAMAEALEVGSRVLLFDESDSGTAFLASDSRLDEIAGAGKRGILPLCAAAREMADHRGVSFVVGGRSSIAEWIPIADTVLRIENFTVSDVTKEAKRLEIRRTDDKPNPEAVARLFECSRHVVPSSLDPSSGRHDAIVGAESIYHLRFGKSVVDLQRVCQLADISQTETIGLILYYAKSRYLREARSIREIMDLVDRDLSTEGLDCLTRDLRCDLARPRRFEIAAALNRLASLRIANMAE